MKKNYDLGSSHPSSIRGTREYQHAAIRATFIVFASSVLALESQTLIANTVVVNGNTTATAISNTSDSDNDASAYGGDGSLYTSPGFDGGAATAKAISNTSGSVEATALAVGGNASLGGLAGTASSFASGTSTTGGDVYVSSTAFGGFGSDGSVVAPTSGATVNLTNSVFASTSGGNVTLIQTAGGGPGGIGGGYVIGQGENSAAGGSASSNLNLSLTGPSSVYVVLEADGAYGGIWEDMSEYIATFERPGGSGSVSANITAAAPITLILTATGGVGGYSFYEDYGITHQNRGFAYMDPVTATSTQSGGEVSITGNFTGGAGTSYVGNMTLTIDNGTNGASAYAYGAATAIGTGSAAVNVNLTFKGGTGGEGHTAGNGAPEMISNAERGSTGIAGTLTFTQEADGGQAAADMPYYTGGNLTSYGTPGIGGAASSVLSISGNASSVSVTTIARGGGGGYHNSDPFDAATPGGRGGSATAISTAYNSGGPAVADATAYSGTGGLNDSDLHGKYGAAVASSSATGNYGSASSSFSPGVIATSVQVTSSSPISSSYPISYGTDVSLSSATLSSGVTQLLGQWLVDASSSSTNTTTSQETATINFLPSSTPIVLGITGTFGTFEELHFLAKLDGSIVLEKTFTSSASASSYFTSNFFNLGAASTSGTLTLQMDVTMNSVSSAFSGGVYFGGGLHAPYTIWTGGGGSWGTGSNWDNTIPDGSYAILNNTSTSSNTITLDSPVSITGLNFTGNGGFTINPGSHGCFTFENAGQNTTLNVFGGNQTIAAPITINDDLLINVAGNTSLTLTANVTPIFVSSVNKMGAGTLTLSGIDWDDSPTYSSTFIDNDGIVNLSGNMGIYCLAVNSTFNFTSGNIVTQDSTSVAAGADFNQSGGNHTTSVFSNNGNYALSAGKLKTTLSTIGGDGVFTQTGGNHTTSTLDLNGCYSFSGGILNSTNSTVKSSGNLTQSGGNFTASTLLDEGGVTLSSGNLTTTTFTNVDSAATFTQSGGSHSTDSLTIGGNYSFSGGTLSTTTATTVESGGAFSQSGGNFTAGALFAKGNFTLSSGNLTTTSTTVDGNTTFTQSGGTHSPTTLDISGTYSQSNGILISTTTTVESGATLSQSGGNHTAATFVNNGNYSLSGGNASLGAVSGNGTIITSSGTSLTADTLSMPTGNVTMNGNLTLTHTSTTRKTSDVAVEIGNLDVSSSTAYIDLKNHDMIIHGGLSISDVKSLLISGRGGCFSWTGNLGIGTTEAGNYTYSLGYATAGELSLTTFDGISVSSSDILIKFTYLGDANLDGVVDSLDNGIVANNYAQSGTDWAHGDFNYDGNTGLADFQAVANHWQYGVGSPMLAFPTGTNTPEPGSLALVSLGIISLLKRRKRWK